MKRLFFFVLICFLIEGINGQSVVDLANQENDGFPVFLSNLMISQDSRLPGMVVNHIEKNRQINGMPGFRVEIYSRSGANAREGAMKIKSEILGTYPEMNVYVRFISPDFKVRAGDFRTRNEALKFVKQIETRYKSFIVPDVIEFPKLEPTE